MDNCHRQFLDNGSSTGCQEALRQLRQSVERGRSWFPALLEAMALWAAPEEVYRGRHCRYLIDGEAFDWPLLAERLSKEVDGLVPQEEKRALFRHGRLPDGVTPEDFKRLLGSAKYRGYLNYYYGVTVEEALAKAAEEEVRKARLSKGYQDKKDLSEEAFLRVYNARRSDLIKAFREERRYPKGRPMTSSESKEFTYWLFKYRLKRSDKARLASDTKKGLQHLQRTGAGPILQ